MATRGKADQGETAPMGQTEEVRVPKTAEIVADRIRKRIIAGELKEGDSLPPEGQLLERFGISRPTLREAFRILEAERLIAVSRGSRTGARVSPPQVGSVSRYASFVLQAEGVRVPDIFEARLAIELFAVRRLCRQAKSSQIKRLRKEVQKLEALTEQEDLQAFIVGLADFHVRLVEEGGNETLLFMIRMLQDLMRQAQLRLLSREREDSEGDGAKAIRSMAKLVDLIEAGDGEEAARHWRLHLINANKKVPYDGTLRDLLKD